MGKIPAHKIGKRLEEVQSSFGTDVILNKTGYKQSLKLTLLLLLLLCITCSTNNAHSPEPTYPLTLTPTPSPLTFTGTWDGAEYGLLIMTQEGQNAFGAYEYLDNLGTTHYGYIRGTVEGKTLTYSWWQSTVPGGAYEEAEERGEGYFVLGQDGASLQGQWRSEDDADWTDEWYVVRQ